MNRVLRNRKVSAVEKSFLEQAKAGIALLTKRDCEVLYGLMSREILR